MLRYTFTEEPEPDENGDWVPWARANYWIEELRAENAKLKAELEEKSKRDPLGEALNSGDGVYRP